MRRFFTKHLFLMVLGFVSIDMMGQAINTLTINSPAGIAGNYEVARANFGSSSNASVTGSAGFIDDGSTTGTGGTIYDGCSTAVNSLTGKIGFVDRGVCSFDAKSLNVQLAGAIAVVICQNATNETQWPLIPGVATQSIADQINVPVFAIKYSDCQKIRADIISGAANVTLQYVCVSGPVPVYPANTVWGDKSGEGDFNGSLNDWIPLSDNGWAWVASGYIPGGPYRGPFQSTSATACNGIAAFDHDALYDDGNGPCTEEDCFAGIVSPNITFSQPVDGLVLEFTQTLANFSSDYLIITSKDGGNTWPDTIVINREYSTFNFNSGERLRIGLCGYENVSQVRLQFAINGNFYYWGIDDVILLNESVADTKVNKNFYAVAPSLKTPASQVSPFALVADITNNGNADAANTKLEVVIKDASDVTVGSVINNYDNVPSCTVIENKVFNETFTPPSTVGVYTGTYTISSDGETINDDNTVPFYFLNTDKTFGNMLTEAQWGAAYMRYIFTNYVEAISGNPYYSIGNAYYASKGKGFKASKVRFGLSNPVAAVERSIVNVDLFAWDDANGDGVSSEDERQKVGSNIVEISNVPSVRNLEVDIWGVDQDGVFEEGKEALLDDNTQYLLMIHSTFFTNVKQEFLGHTPRVFNEDQQSMTYNAVNLAFDSLGLNRASGSFFNFTSGNAEDDPSLRDYYQIANEGPAFNLGGVNAFVEMDIEIATSSTYDIAKSGTANVFPNPASRELYIDVTLNNVSANVRVDLVTIEGKVATSKSFTNVQDSRLKLDLSGLTSGTYTAMIHTDNGVIAKKVVVQK